MCELSTAPPCYSLLLTSRKPFVFKRIQRVSRYHRIRVNQFVLNNLHFKLIIGSRVWGKATSGAEFPKTLSHRRGFGLTAVQQSNYSPLRAAIGCNRLFGCHPR